MIWGVLFCSWAHCASEPQKGPFFSELIENSRQDYTYMWWLEGFHGAKVRCVQTNNYGMMMDERNMGTIRLGSIASKLGYEQASKQPNKVMLELPTSPMLLTITVGGSTYTCQSAKHSRLIASGRWLQRGDVMGLVFKDESGKTFPGQGRLEFFAWPDRLSFVLSMIPDRDLTDVKLKIEINSVKESLIHKNWKKGATQDLHAVIFENTKTKPVELEAKVADGEKVVPVHVETAQGWQRIEVPKPKGYKAHEAHLQRLLLKLKNPSSRAQPLHLNFDLQAPFPGMTGWVPMFRDTERNPLPIPIQISKNWHRKKGQTLLYEGPWGHGLTMLTLPPKFEGELEFCVIRNFWGTLPVASHSQLSLIGWGKDQLWDQAAIGSWGESICYDPDICLDRSMIDDIRPLMVTRKDTKDEKWGWTNNVGGGDFLVYHNMHNRRQPLVRMKTAYLSQGPNLTDVVYAGRSLDGVIEASIRVQTPRCDDLNRAYHTIRYDVVKPFKFKRLAFYQLGADNYNDHQFKEVAMGTEDGLVEKWKPKTGGKKYHRQFIPLSGKNPWFSLHDSISKDKKGAWANRGMVLRSWKSKLGGKAVEPRFSSFGTQNRFDSCNIEIVPPARVKELFPGDFIEATIELLVVPQYSKDYYGPSQSFSDHLAKTENTWKPIFRQAKEGGLEVKVTQGQLVSTFPVEVRVDKVSGAEFMIKGGVGYTPITLIGLDRHKGWLFERFVRGKWEKVDQSKFGNDYWQVGQGSDVGFTLTHNVLLDSNHREQRFRLVTSR
jgi:hypothetical protein